MAMGTINHERSIVKCIFAPMENNDGRAGFATFGTIADHSVRGAIT
jgi:hypothetical protein